VFLTLKRPVGVPYEKYRATRYKLIEVFCLVVRATNPDAKTIVGIATSPFDEPGSGEDLSYLDGSVWTGEMQADALELQKELNILTTNLKRYEARDSEYPEQPLDLAKGRNRNLRCPCGSGKKVKHCFHG
jgi:hypothetical protein